MSEALVLIEYPVQGIAILTLNRPQKRNALNLDLLKAFCAEMTTLQQDELLRVIIVRGGGSVFCAGMDLHEAVDIQIEEESALWISHAFRAIYHCPLVTIAALHGAAIGGGAGLASAFDLVLAAEGTIYGFPEVQRGLVPAQIAPFLKRQVSWHVLRELLLLGELIDARKAQTLGLISAVTSASELIPTALQLAHQALKGAPGAIKLTKRLLEALDNPSIDEELLKTMPYHHEARHSSEAREGVQAFLDKRKAAWS